MSNQEYIKRYKIDEFNYPNGYRELVINENIINKEGNKKGRKGTQADKVPYQTKQVNICRVKKKMRRYSLINGLNRMVTLTTRANIQEVDKMDYLFKQFLKNLKRKYPKYKDLKYLGSREVQERGSVHLHFLIDRYIPHHEAYPVWLAVCGSGTINFRHRGIKAINYVIKYIEKGLNENAFITEKGFSKKAYYMSKNLDKNIEARKKTYEYNVKVENGKEIVMSNYNFVDIILQEVREAKEQGRLLWDNESSYKIKEEVKTCRNILMLVT